MNVGSNFYMSTANRESSRLYIDLVICGLQKVKTKRYFARRKTYQALVVKFYFRVNKGVLSNSARPACAMLSSIGKIWVDHFKVYTLC